jgi:hypothetical protein
MSHSDDPRDSCGGARRCGGNLLVSTAAPQKKGSTVGRNLRAAADLVTSLRASVALRKGM